MHPFSLPVFICKGVPGRISCRCNHTFICMRLACRTQMLHPLISGKWKTHGCSYGSSRTLACTRMIFEVCFLLLVAARWRMHHDTRLESSRSWDIDLRPGRKERIVCVSYTKKILPAQNGQKFLYYISPIGGNTKSTKWIIWDFMPGELTRFLFFTKLSRNTHNLWDQFQ